MYLITSVKNINNTLKNSECSNHLISNQADLSLEALKKQKTKNQTASFINTEGTKKEPLHQTRKSKHCKDKRKEKPNFLINVLVSQLLRSQYLQT